MRNATHPIYLYSCGMCVSLNIAVYACPDECVNVYDVPHDFNRVQ